MITATRKRRTTKRRKKEEGDFIKDLQRQTNVCHNTYSLR